MTTRVHRNARWCGGMARSQRAKRQVKVPIIEVLRPYTPSSWVPSVAVFVQRLHERG
jgi:hypothetical protein